MAKPILGKMRRVLCLFGKSKASAIGFTLFAVIVAIALLSPVIRPFDPHMMNVADTLSPPSPEHIMGTDMYGRDVFSRVLEGFSVSMAIGAIVVFFSMLIGVPLGLLSGYTRGIGSESIMRIVDIMLCFPWVLVALCIAAIIGAGTRVVITSLTIAYIPTFIRLMQGVVLSIREKEYVEAAIVTGESKASVLWRYVLPNCAAPLIVEATLVMSFVIISEAAISYLGVGVQPPTSSLGAMLSESMTYIQSSPYLCIFPGIAIVIAVVAINVFGDGLRDVLDRKYVVGMRGKKRAEQSE